MPSGETFLFASPRPFELTVTTSGQGDMVIEFNWINRRKQKFLQLLSVPADWVCSSYWVLHFPGGSFNSIEDYVTKENLEAGEIALILIRLESHLAESAVRRVDSFDWWFRKSSPFQHLSSLEQINSITPGWDICEEFHPSEKKSQPVCTLTNCLITTTVSQRRPPFISALYE